MPRSFYPGNGYQTSFRRKFSDPSSPYDSDEDENQLERARELYKNLQGSPGGWQTHALKGYSQQLKRRIREGEEARSLLASQLDESRLNYDKLNLLRQDYENKLRDEYSQHAHELQSQSERFSETSDKNIDLFAGLVKKHDSEKYNDIMSEGMTPRMSQNSIYSVNAPKSFYDSIESLYDQHLQKYNQAVKESLLKDAELHRLRPMEQEYKNYRREASPLKRAYPNLVSDLNKNTQYLKNVKNKITEISDPKYGWSIYSYNPDVTRATIRQDALIDVLKQMPTIDVSKYPKYK